jgi:glyoxylase-like metal-dependent hydrolase (beta-lactamase superfamily II)
MRRGDSASRSHTVPISAIYNLLRSLWQHQVHMKVGRFTISLHNHGFFRLDGGAMFGAVPRAIWAKGAAPDEENRILLATRSLIVEDGDRKMIIDLGCGDKWDEKSRSIFCIPDWPYVPVPGVTDVLLTHMHFDHAGGISREAANSERGARNVGSRGVRPHPPSGTSPGAGEDSIEPCYPGARHFLPSANYENAKQPNAREKASYLPENVDALEMVELVLTEDGQEVCPGVRVHQSDGHTRGLQWVEVSDGDETIAFPADLFPTSKHLPLPYGMGYDMCAEKALLEKADFLRRAVEGRWIVVFEHDPEVGAARLEFDSRGRAVISELVMIEEA